MVVKTIKGLDCKYLKKGGVEMAVKNVTFTDGERSKRVRVVSRAFVMSLKRQGKLEKIADGLYRKKNS